MASHKIMGALCDALAFALFVAILPAAAVLGQQSTVPYLYITMARSPRNKPAALGQLVSTPNYQRIPLQICLKASIVEDAFEPLSIKASNQEPNYFQNRSGPNVTLSVKRISDTIKPAVPFRVISSGVGKDLTVHHVDADIDILEHKAVREQRVQQFIAWMKEEAQKEDPARAGSLLPQAPPAIAAYLDEQYVNNPLGIYEITARYAPTTARVGDGVLVS
jgi:hypothetical protein